MHSSNFVRLILIIIACGLARRVAAQNITLRLITAEWKEAYTEVFGRCEKVLSDSEVNERVTFLLEEIDTVSHDRSITDQMRATVQFWNKALGNDDRQHCTVEYLDSLRRRLVQLQDPPSANLQTLFSLIQGNLILLCSGIHQKSSRDFYPKFDTATELNLVKILLHYESWIGGGISGDNLADTLFKVLKVGRSSSEHKIMSAWNQGACGRLLATLEETQAGVPPWRSVIEFNKILTYGSELFKLPKTDDNWYIRIIDACNQLTRMLPELIRNRGLKAIFARRSSADTAPSYARSIQL